MELPLTPLDLLTRARRLFPDRVGVVDGDVRRTYTELAGRCDRLAAALRDELGVAPGDRVAWLCGNTSELLEAYFGVLLAGAVLLPLNIRLAPAESRFVLGDAGARLLFRHPDQPDPLAGVTGPDVRQVVLGPDYEALLARQDAAPFPVPEVDERAVAELFYTSGSTGSPKGVLLTHRALYLHAIHSALTSGIAGDDVILHTIPLFHVNGWGTPHYLTGLGGVHVMLPRFDPGEVLRLIEEERVTRLFAVPAMVRLLLDHPDVATRDLSSLRQASIGGAPTSPMMLAEVEARFGCTCICGYGMTESSPTLTRSLDKPGEAPSAARRATTGLPILGVDARVLDDDDVEVPWDGETTGEVCARSNHVMAGYWNRPEETAAALRGGWLRTGDIAVVDPDGYLTLVDRKNDLIISGGENVSTVEVEHAIATHPAVHEVAVVGVADERWGEVPKAWVALRPGAELTEGELLAFTRERLAGFKTPKSVVFLDELPHGGTGKIMKHDLRRRG
ncbi:MAG: long-chain-fatty-acid--CoA ligase [Actinomycetota bacterium]|nr:long-chain-fatty-acid--CoA ligase [Actinomycetota bacterium]